MDVVVGGLAEVIVPCADREEGLGGSEADEVVDFPLKIPKALPGGDGDGDDDLGGTLGLDGVDGDRHGGAGGKAVVGDDHGSAGELWWRTVAAVEGLAAAELLLLVGGDAIDGFVGQPEVMDDVFVQEAHAAGGDGAHGELRLSGDTELSDDESVEIEV